MDHIGIDLGSRESQVCRRSQDGTIIEQRRYKNASLKAQLKQWPKSRVVMETGAEAFAMADAALEAGHEVRVVPCSLVRSLGVGARKTKNDERDAQVVSEVSCRIDLPSVHIPSRLSRERKTLCGMREALVRSRVVLVLTVRGWLRTQHRTVSRGSVNTFASRVRKLYQEKSATTLPVYVERQLVAIESLTEQIVAADEELARTAQADPACQRMMTTPGVGPVTAVRFRAALDESSRFDGAHAVQSYLGLVPGEHSSGERQRRTAITKAGPSSLRWALVQAAWSVLRTKRADPLGLWAQKISLRRGRWIAVVALARKLAGILYAIWRDGTTYQAQRTAAPLPTPG
jgi:transposase